MQKSSLIAKTPSFKSIFLAIIHLVEYLGSKEKKALRPLFSERGSIIGSGRAKRRLYRINYSTITESSMAEGKLNSSIFNTHICLNIAF